MKHTCKNCIFRSMSLSRNKAWKCKVWGKIKRFNFPSLHGWFCKYFKEESEDDVNE